MIITKYIKFLESINTNDMWEIIPESVKELHTLFKKAGKSLYVVGGSVRDFLNSDKPKDFDLATDATPDEVLSIIGKKWRTTTQGESFFVVVVYTEDQPKGMEIATFREDVYGDLLGKTRNPVTKFSTIDKDVERRDLTWNALFYDLEKKSIIDLVGGIEDLKNNVTKFVGDPAMRITEDPLRILRLFRFTSRYGFKIDPNSAKAIEDNKDKLKIIVPERIWDEFYKAYGQIKDFTVYLNYIEQFGLWNYIFPGSNINSSFVESKSFMVVIASLFKNENVDGLKDRMVQKYKIPDSPESGRFASKVVFLIQLLTLTPENVTEIYSKRQQCAIDNSSILEWYKANNINDNVFMKFLEYKPSISAQDLMSKGFKGPALGKEIKRLEIEKFKNML